ncbi:MAG: hypothetical protein ACJA0S_001246 [Rickettsiales bacterium]|jgi:hypothetical protein
MKNKPILFIVEKTIIDGKSYFGSSNDLLLISSALKMGFEVYVATPTDVVLNHNKTTNFLVLKLSKNIDAVDEELTKFFAKEVINCLLALPPKPTQSEKEQSGILFLRSKKTEIDLNKVLIFNRAEPISLNDKFYDLLILWQNLGIKISPNPYLNKILGDKLAINAIHENFPIAGINLLEGVDFAKGENEISFKTKIIPISKNDLSGDKISEFYDLLIDKNFSKANEEFGAEYRVFIQGAEGYLEFHKELENDSILKPADYFGGVGIVVVKNQTLDLGQAISNIAQSFLAIKKDSNGNGKAFLPSIIIQKRASEAHLGDLRIVFCGGNLQGVFIRINPDFEKSKANNIRFGGHPESLFKHYEISKEGVDLMVADISDEVEIRKSQALYGILEIIAFLKQIKVFSQYAIIGADALLSCDKYGNYKYKINEVNITSPMGQVQLLLLQIAIKFSDESLKILNQKGVEIELKKHQILADFFKEQNADLTLKAKDILLSDQNFQEIIGREIRKILKNNIAFETLEFFAK